MAAGIFSQFNFGVEAKGDSNYGVRVPATHIVEVSDGSGINFNLELQPVEVVNGQLAKNVCTYPGQADTSGTIDIPFFPAVVPYFMYSLLGTVTTSAHLDENEDTVSGVYDHVFTESPLRPTLTIEETIGDLPRVATGFQPTQMTLTVDNEGLINTSFEGFAKNIEVLDDPTTATAALGCPMHHADEITVTIDGVEFATLQSIEITYNNNVSPEYTVTGGSAVAYRGIGKTEYSGSMTMVLDSNAPTEYQKYLESTSRDIEIHISGAEIGETGVKQQLIVSMPNVKFSNFECNATMETVTADVEFMGLFDKSTNKHIEFTVINEVSSLAS